MVRSPCGAWIRSSTGQIGALRARRHRDIALRSRRVSVLLSVRTRLRYRGTQVRVKGRRGCHVRAVSGDGAQVRSSEEVGMYQSI